MYLIKIREKYLIYSDNIKDFIDCSNYGVTELEKTIKIEPIPSRKVDLFVGYI